MSDRSGIEWTDATWNPVTGCTKVSPGCDHCYAETLYNRFNGPGAFDTVTLRPERLDQPLRWRKPRRIFVNSMSDLFHEKVPDEYIADVWHRMAESPQHTFQILTKRHARMRSWVTKWCSHPQWTTPLPNVWLGVSVENQQWADIRIPALLDTPAVVRFLSCEPLLGPVDLARWTRRHTPDCLNEMKSPPWCTCGRDADGYLDWVIVGGESGRGARPMDAAWPRQIRDRCKHSDIPFHFKQWGGHDQHGAPVHKKVAGRVLDGRTWDEYPQAVTT